MTHFYPGLAISASVVPRHDLTRTTATSGSWRLDVLPDLGRITAHTQECKRRMDTVLFSGTVCSSWNHFTRRHCTSHHVAGLPRLPE